MLHEFDRSTATLGNPRGRPRELARSTASPLLRMIPRWRPRLSTIHCLYMRDDRFLETGSLRPVPPDRFPQQTGSSRPVLRDKISKTGFSRPVPQTGSSRPVPQTGSANRPVPWDRLFETRFPRPVPLDRFLRPVPPDRFPRPVPPTDRFLKTGS